MINSNVMRVMLLSGAGYASLMAPSAAAQTAQGTPPQAAAVPVDPAATTPSDSDNSANQLTDIIVTANKREESLNRVGITVAALSAETLEDRQVNTLEDLTLAVPTLTYANSPSGTPVISLRGVGFYEISLAAFPTVSLYVDQVTLPFPIFATHASFDLERVEVLKGPQGILFGQNATGGAINFIAAKPTEETRFGGSAGFGRFNAATAEGYVSGSIGPTLTARLAGRYTRADGWQVSNSRPDDRNGKIDALMGRFQLNWQPSPSANFLLALTGWRDKGEPQAGQYIGLNVQQGNALINPGLARIRFSPEEPRAADWNPGLPFRDNRFLQASLRADIDVTSDISLTSITAYSDYDQRQAEDFDGVEIGVDDFTEDNGTIKAFSQEIRLSNAPSNKFRWVIGGNFNDYSVDQSFIYLFDAASSNTALGIEFARFGSEQTMQDYAGFGSADLDISDVITLKAGLRYTDSTINATSCGTDFNGPDFVIGNLFYDILVGGVAGRYRLGQCYGINNLGREVNGVAAGSPGRYRDTLEQDNLSWRAGVDIKPNAQTLFYAGITRGYKAGSFPTVGASLFSQYQPVDQESVTSYEAGAKLGLFDRRVQLNAAIYYYDYKDKQLRSRTRDPVFGDLDILQNIPKSSVRGAEIEITARPVSGLTLTAAATYTDATIDEFVGRSAAGIDADFAGARVPFTPKWQLSFGADKSIPLRSGLDLTFGTSVTHRSSTVASIGGETNAPTATPQNKTLFGIDSFTLVDLRAGVKGDGWRIGVWGKNVFNEYYWNNVSPAFDTIVRYAGQPATYGATVGFEF